MLEAFFSPNGVAVIGASTDPTKLGYAILQNVLDSGYDGNVFAVNPNADEILGVPTYAESLGLNLRTLQRQRPALLGIYRNRLLWWSWWCRHDLCNR